MSFCLLYPKGKMQSNRKILILTPSYGLAQKYKKSFFQHSECELPRFISYDDIPTNLFLFSPQLSTNKVKKYHFHEKIKNLINANLTIKEALKIENKNKNSEINNPIFVEQATIFEQLKSLKNPDNIFYIKSLCPNLYEQNFEDFFDLIGIKNINESSYNKKEVFKLSYSSKFDLAKSAITLINQSTNPLKIVSDDNDKLTALRIFGLDEQIFRNTSEIYGFSFFIAITRYVYQENFQNALGLLTHPSYKNRISDDDIINIRNLENKSLKSLFEIKTLKSGYNDLAQISATLKTDQPAQQFLKHIIHLHQLFVTESDKFENEYNFLSNLSNQIRAKTSEDLCENFILYINNFSKISYDYEKSIFTNDLNNLTFSNSEVVLLDDELLIAIQRNYKHLNIKKVIAQIPAKKIIIFYKNSAEHSLALFDNKITEINITNNEIIKETRKHQKPELIINTPPSNISMSGIEKLIRNPYVFALQYLLKLRPLTSIFEHNNEKNFGILVHDIISCFSTEYHLPFEDKLKLLEPILEKKISKYSDIESIKNLWKKNLKIILLWWHMELERFSRSKFHFEAQGQSKVENIGISARADLIAEDNDKISIIDFKTGAIPSNKDVISGLFPQLTLEAFIAENNGFESVKAGTLEILYIKLSAKEEGCEIKPITCDYKSIDLELKKLFEQTINLGSYFCTTNDHDSKLSNFKHMIRKEEWFDQF